MSRVLPAPPPARIPARILVIQLRQIGDVVMTTPALRALRAAFPDAHIAYLTESAAAPLVETFPEVDAVLVAERSSSPWAMLWLVRALRRERFDLVIDFLANPRTARLVRWSGAGETVADARSRRARQYTLAGTVTGEYSAAQKLSLLRAIGIDGDDCALSAPALPAAAARVTEYLRAEGLSQELTYGDGSRGSPLVCMDVTHRRVTRCWTPEGFAAVADALHDDYGAAVIFLHAPGETEVVNAVRERCAHPHRMAFRTTLPELVALLARADLVVGNDSAPRHLSVAVGTPTVTIHGSNRVENWTPPPALGGGTRHRVVVRDGLACRPCHKNTCHVQGMPCMTEVTPEMVMAAVGEVFSATQNMSRVVEG